MSRRDRQAWNMVYPPGHPKHISVFNVACQILGAYVGAAALAGVCWVLCGLRF